MYKLSEVFYLFFFFFVWPHSARTFLCEPINNSPNNAIINIGFVEKHNALYRVFQNSRIANLERCRGSLQ
jgi:hypothetical protein